MPGIGAMQVNITSDISSLLRGIAESTKALKGMEKAGQQTAEHTSKITAGMGKAWNLVKVAIAGVITGATIHSLNAAAETVDKLGKSSARLGIGVEQLSALRFAAAEADVDFDNLSKIIGKAAKTIGELSRSQDTIFVGNVMVRLKDATGHVRSMTELLPDLATGLESVGSQAEQLNLASKFFGKEGGGQFVQLLKESGGFMENLATQTERAKRLGVIFNDDQVEKLTAYNDAVGRISEAWLGLRVNIVTRVAPELTKLANGLASGIAAIPDVIKKVVDVFAGMWSDPKLRSDFVAFTESLGTIWWIAIKGQMIIAAAAVQELLGTVLPKLGKPLCTKLGQDYSKWFLNGWAGIFEQVAQVGDEHGAIPSILNNWAVAMRTGASKIGAESGQEMLAQLEDAVSGWQLTSEASSQVWANLENAFQQAAERGDALFDISAIIKSHSMDLGDLFKSKTGNDPDKKISELQQHWIDFAQKGKEAIESFSQSWSDATTEMLFTGKSTFQELAIGYAKTLTSMALNTMIFAPIFKQLGAGFASGLGVPEANSGTTSYSPFVFSDSHFANGDAAIAMKPTRFPMRGGTGVVGDDGPELVTAFPLARVGGKLAIRGAGGGGTLVQVIDQRSSGATPEVRESTGPDGRKIVRVFVRDELANMARDGSLDKVLNPFGARRTPTPR
ncbi:MAG: hypothetical protein ACREJD_09375 [Phycisphaerales bacterium]